MRVRVSLFSVKARAGRSAVLSPGLPVDLTSTNVGEATMVEIAHGAREASLTVLKL